jgi:plastocyanin
VTLFTLRYRSVHALVLGLLAAGLATGASACAGAGQEPQTHTVVMEGLAYRPQALTVRAGDRIVWVNKDLFPHTATSKPGAFDSGGIAAGESWMLTAAERGSFEYLCTYHPTMKGRLVVE